MPDGNWHPRDRANDLLNTGHLDSLDSTKRRAQRGALSGFQGNAANDVFHSRTSLGGDDLSLDR